MIIVVTGIEHVLKSGWFGMGKYLVYRVFAVHTTCRQMRR